MVEFEVLQLIMVLMWMEVRAVQDAVGPVVAPGAQGSAAGDAVRGCERSTMLPSTKDTGHVATGRERLPDNSLPVCSASELRAIVAGKGWRMASAEVDVSS